MPAQIISRRRIIGITILLLGGLFAIWALRPETPPDPRDPRWAKNPPAEQDRATRAYLASIHDVYRWKNVWPADGEFLHDTLVERGYRRGLEIGTSNGYSAIWMGMALQKTGGHLITVEIDPELAARARQNFKQMKMEEIIELQEGDAFKVIPELEGTFDFVFIDAWKEDYLRYFQLVYPRVRPGGAILAHDVVWHAQRMDDFLHTIQSHPGLDTRIATVSGAGISVSIKR